MHSVIVSESKRKEKARRRGEERRFKLLKPSIEWI